MDFIIHIKFRYLLPAFTRQMLKTMKLTVILLLGVCIQVTAKDGLAQITLSENNTPFSKVIEKIQAQSDYDFVSTYETMKEAGKVTVNVRNVSLRKALEECMKEKPLTYSIIGKTVVIKTKRVPYSSEEIDMSRLQALPLSSVEVRGRVTDENGNALVGVSVSLKENPSIGTTTDEHGYFSLFIENANGVLVFSSVGYVSKEMRIGGKSTINAILQTTTSSLEDVVVIGYGTQKRSEITGSMFNIRGSDIGDQPVTSFENSLSGRATGVNMIAGQGILNQAPVFRIRGTNSLSLSTYPLIVIDGVPSFTAENETGIGYAPTNPLSSINPTDIESIDIAKDAAATSIYGSRAANGVVFITTKKGQRGDAKVNFQSWVGINTPTRLPKLLNTDQYIEIKNEGLVNDGSFNQTSNFYGTTLDENGKIINTNWYDFIYQNGKSSNSNLNISGGNQSTHYYGSIGYSNQEGIFRKTDYIRKSAMFSIDTKANSWLSIGGKINYVNDKNSSPMSYANNGDYGNANGMSRLALITAPIIAPYNRDGSYNSTSSGFVGIGDNAGHLNQSRLGFHNPVIAQDNNYSKNSVNTVQSTAFVQFAPYPWLILKSNYGIDLRLVNYDDYFSPLSGDGISPNGRSRSSSSRRERWVWTNTLNINKTIADKHNFGFLFGEEEQKTTGSEFGLQRDGQTDPYYENIQGGWQSVFIFNTNNQVTDNYLFSLFSRLQYNFQKKYFVALNYRQDEYSALGKDNKKGDFWGVSSGWEISSENFWQAISINKVVNYFKLRASFGKVGNVGGLDDFGALNTYSAALYGGQAALVFSGAGNSMLKWENSKKTDIGLNYGLFENSITGEISYYNNNIDGLIFGVPVPPSVGIPNSTQNTILQNVDSMYNRGFEFSISALLIKRKKFGWNTSLNFSTNTNRIKELADGVPNILAGTTFSGYTISEPNKAIGMIYVVRTGGVDPQTGRKVFWDANGRKVFYQHSINASLPAKYQWEYEDGSRAPAINPSVDGISYKNPAPKVYGGFNNIFRYSNFELDALITYQFGGYLWNGTLATTLDQRFWNNSEAVMKRWKKPGDITTIARVINGDNVSGGNSMPLDDAVSSSDFLRLKSIRLSYKFSNELLSKIHLSGLTLFVNGQNLAIITSYNGMDPEVSTYANNPLLQGIDKNQSPNSTAFTIGINASF